MKKRVLLIIGLIVLIAGVIISNFAKFPLADVLGYAITMFGAGLAVAGMYEKRDPAVKTWVVWLSIILVGLGAFVLGFAGVAEDTVKTIITAVFGLVVIIAGLIVPVVIPKNKKEFKASELNIEELLKERKETKTYIGIPKFSFNSQNDLNKLYQNYNIGELFTSKANLHLMSNKDLFVKQMYQIETITIGEYGTVKSTTKTKSLSTKSIDDSVKKVVLNRPFIFLIMNNETNEVLFIGRFNKPN